MKKIVYKILLVFIISFLFFGCDSDEETKDTTPPTFLMPTEISVYENSDFVVKIKAEDDSSLHYFLSGKDSALFDIDENTGVVVFKNKFDYELFKHTFELNVTLKDASHSISQPLTIHLLNENDNMPLFINSLNVFVDENQLDVITLNAQDDDDDDKVIYSISSFDADFFNIDETNGSIYFKVAPNYEERNLYTFLATASDGEFKTTRKVSVYIKNLNEVAPTFTTPSILSVYSEDENAFVTVQADDGDNNLSTLNYFLVGGSDKTKCDIDLFSGKITFKSTPDYNAQPSYNLEVLVSDGVFDANQTLQVNVRKRNGFLNDTVINVEENQYSVITLMHDETFSDNADYAIHSGDVDYFNLDSSTGVIVFKNAPDYEVKNRYEFVAVINEGSKTQEVGITVNIIDINDNQPYFTSENNISIRDRFTKSITLEAVDQDGGTLEYSITGDDSGSFNINNQTGELTFKELPDYDTKNIYNITARVSDGELFSDANITINILEYKNPFEIVKIEANDKENNDYFGNSVSISGDYIVVGAKYEDTENIDNGSAYLFKKENDNLTQIAKLQADDKEENDYFGRSVAISGDYIAIGANYEDTGESNAGAVYIFKRESDSNVTQIAKIQADDKEENDYFGGSVAIFEDYIVVGAIGEDTGGNRAGATYIFKRESDDNITQIAKIQADDKEENDYFGRSVAIFEDYIVVGANYEDTGGSNAGAAYIFKRESDDNITQIAKIQADDNEENDHFGRSVAIFRDYIVVGANYESTGSNASGAAYIFKKEGDDSITQIAKIQADDKEENDYFGRSVAIFEDYIVVGANGEDTGGSKAGAAYIFKRESDSNVTQIAKIQAADNEKNDEFGQYVSISGDYIVTGTVGKNGETGAAYLFSMEPKPKIYIRGRTIFSLYYDESNIKSDIYTFNVATPDDDNISYSLSGIDNGSFRIEENDLFFDIETDYENAMDDDANNDYNITITLETTNGYKEELNSTVIVQDKIYPLVQKIQPDDSTNEDNFARGLAIDGNYSVISSNQGTYLFYKDSSTITQKAKIDKYGPIAIENDYIIISRYLDDDAYIYKKEEDDSLTELALLESDDKENGDYFGRSVSISGDYIVIGATAEDTGGNNAGAAYIFKRESDDNITQIAKIQADDKEENDYFGRSVAIFGDYIVVGANGEDTGSSKAGAAYVFKRESDDNITQIAKIQADDKEENDEFGQSVSISGDYIVVGANYEDAGGTDVGAAYIFKRESDDNVTQIAKIQAHDKKAYNNFGSSVVISGDNILVGSAESAYLFKKDSDDNIIEVEKYVKSNPRKNDYFGSTISMSEDTIAIGAYGENTININAGSVYYYIKE